VCYNPNEVQPAREPRPRAAHPAAFQRVHIVQCDPRTKSTYNSLQGKLLKRFSGGLQFLASYTFGKSLDYARPRLRRRPPRNGQTVTRMDLWRGPSGFDVKHRFVLSYVWDLPFGRTGAGCPAAWVTRSSATGR